MGIDDLDVSDDGLETDVRRGIEVGVDAVMCKRGASRCEQPKNGTQSVHVRPSFPRNSRAYEF